MNKIDSVIISMEQLEKICKSALIARGATDEEAKLVYQDYLDAELRGRKSHGLVALHLALGEFPIKGKYEIVSQSESYLRIQANGACGHVVARRAIDIALPNVEKYGCSIVGIQNSTRFNCPGPIARYAVERGLIAIVLYYGGENLMAAYGGKKRALSTNPIGIGIPLEEDMPPFVLDIATSERAMGYVSLARLLGKDIPLNWGTNALGETTNNPNELLAVKPFGGYKGFGIALAVEILVGPLLGVPVGSFGSLGCRGTLMFLIHPTAFGESRDVFLHQASRFIKEIKESGDDQAIAYPGELGEERFKHAIETGHVTLPVAVFNKLKEDLSK